MIEKLNCLVIGMLVLCGTVFGQTDEKADGSLKDNWVLNFVNPALEYEWASGKNTLLSTALGVGYNGAYKELTLSGGGFNYIIQPFVDLQYKLMFNRQKRIWKNKVSVKNSRNFVSFRAIARGWPLTDNLIKSDHFDFVVGSTWGMQRSYGNFRILMDLASFNP